MTQHKDSGWTVTGAPKSNPYDQVTITGTPTDDSTLCTVKDHSGNQLGQATVSAATLEAGYTMPYTPTDNNPEVYAMRTSDSHYYVQLDAQVPPPSGAGGREF